MATGRLGHTMRSVLKLQADAHDEGRAEIINWNDFREWFHRKYCWYPDESILEALRLYLKEKEGGN